MDMDVIANSGADTMAVDGHQAVVVPPGTASTLSHETSPDVSAAHTSSTHANGDAEMSNSDVRLDNNASSGAFDWFEDKQAEVDAEQAAAMHTDSVPGPSPSGGHEPSASAEPIRNPKMRAAWVQWKADGAPPCFRCSEEKVAADHPPPCDDIKFNNKLAAKAKRLERKSAARSARPEPSRSWRKTRLDVQMPAGLQYRNLVALAQMAPNEQVLASSQYL